MWSELALALVHLQGSDASDEASDPLHSVVELEIGPGSRVLDGHGPSVAYEFDSDFSGTLYVWTKADGIDLFLRIEDDSGSIQEDADSGGGTTPCVAVQVELDRQLVVQVALQDAETLANRRTIELHLVAAPETDATRSAAASWQTAVGRVAEIARAGDRDGARRLLTATLEELRAVAGAEQSSAIAAAVLDLGAFAMAMEALPTQKEAFSFVAAHRGRMLPEDHPKLLAARGNLAMALFSLGDLPGSRDLLERVLAGFERSRPPDHLDVLLARMNLALPLQSMGEHEAARDLLDQAVEGFERTCPPDDPNLLRARQNLANTFYATGEFARARDLLLQILAVAERTLAPDHPNLLGIRLSLAATLMDLGDVPAARAMHEQVLEIYESTLPADHPKLLAARMNFAVILRAEGDLSGSRALLERVLEARERTLPEDHSDLLLTRMNLAIALQTMGDLLGSRASFERVLEAYERTMPEDNADLLMTRMNLAVTLFLLGDDPGAQRLLERVVEIRERTLPADHGDLLMARLNLALVLQSSGDVSRAKALLEGVVQGYDRTLPEDHPTRLTARLDLALMLKAAHELPEARDLLQYVLESYERTRPPEHPDVLTARANLATTLYAMGDSSGARELLPALLSGMATRVLSTFSLAPREAREIVGVDAKRIDHLLFLSEDAGPTERARVFELIETQRLVALESPRAVYMVATDPDLERLSTSAAEARSKQNDLVGGGAGHRDSDLRPQLAEVLRERDVADGAIRAKLAARGLFAQAITSDALVAALPPKSAAVGYLRHEHFRADDTAHELTPMGDHLLAHVLRTDGKLARIDLGPAAELEDLVLSWRAAVGISSQARGLRVEASAPADDLAAHLGERLRERLLDPVLAAAGEGMRTLFVCPDDLVYLVPLDAFDMGAGRVGDHLRIVVESSFRRLIHPPTDPIAAGVLLALGDVSYDEAIATRGPLLAANSAPIESSLRAGAGRGAFGPLPGTSAEIDALSEAFERAFDREPMVLRGGEATRGALAERAPGARFVHIATHGWFAPESVKSTLDDASDDRGWSPLSLTQSTTGFAPMTLCGLALSGANRDRDALGHVPGILTAEELCALDLSNCELAVLSACETNVGIRRAGQGIQSLQAALHAAGARTAITSLWKVDDAATRKMMELFYSELWVEKRSKADALWEAKRTLRAAGHPLRDWAGWVLSGNPE